VLIDNSITVIEDKPLELSFRRECAVHLLRLFDSRLFIRRVDIATVLQDRLRLPYARFEYVEPVLLQGHIGSPYPAGRESTNGSIK